MEIVPKSAAPRRTLSFEDSGSWSAGRHPATPPKASYPLGASPDTDEQLAIISGPLQKESSERHCWLVGCYFLYSEPVKKGKLSASVGGPAGSKPKSLCLSDMFASFNRSTRAIRLVKGKAGDSRMTSSGSAEKDFVAKTDTEFYAWQAAITRAIALWPGAMGRAAVAPDDTPLAAILRWVIATWVYTTLATSVDVLTDEDVADGVSFLRISSHSPPSAHCGLGGGGDEPQALDITRATLCDATLGKADLVSKGQYNSILVNTLVQLPQTLSRALKAMLSSMQGRRGKSADSAGVRELVEGIAQRLERAAEEFVCISLAYGYDIATGLWPMELSASGAVEPAASTDARSCIELLRMWFTRAPTAPWAAILGIGVKYLGPWLRDSLNLRPRSGGHPHGPGLNGIRNLGNTCYLNSVLQCLVHTPQLIRYFLLRAQQLFVGPDKDRAFLATHVGDLACRAWTSSGTLDAARVANYLIDHDEIAFRKGDQHDAHEALVTILDVLDSDLSEGGATGSAERRKRKGRRGRVSGAAAPPPEALPDYTTAELTEDELVSRWRAGYVRAHNSIITHYFSGQVVQRLTCPGCEVASYCCDSFTYIIAPVVSALAKEQSGASATSHSTTATSVSRSANVTPTPTAATTTPTPAAATTPTPSPAPTPGTTPRVSVSASNGGTAAQPAVTIEECLAEVFRTETVEMADGAKCPRCDEPIREQRRTLELQRLPPYLLVCLNRFEMDDHGKCSAKRDVPVMVRERLVLGRWLRSAAELPILGEGGNVHFSQMDCDAAKRGGYELYAAVLHSGSISSGHYTAACRVGPTWYEYSDSEVRRLSSCWFEDEAYATKVYLLFYRSTAGDI